MAAPRAPRLGPFNAALCALCALLLAAFAHAAGPRHSPLFVIARSTNANVVEYAASLDADGKARREEPIVAQWIMNARGGGREDLTWIERQLAYGFEVSEFDARGFTLRLVAFPKRGVRVASDASGSYHAYTRIGGRTALLERIFVQVDGGGLFPSVRYAVLYGTDAATHARLYERLDP